MTGGDTISVALSTLAVAVLFQPLRRRVQRIVDRRFDRARFDADRTSRGVLRRLRYEVDIGAVCGDLRETVQDADPAGCDSASGCARRGPMMRRLARPYAIVGLVAAGLVGAVRAVALRIVDPVPMAANSFGFGDASLLGFEFFGITFSVVGALLVVRRPTNAVGWCMVLIGAAHALAGCAAAVTSSALADGPSPSGPPS